MFKLIREIRSKAGELHFRRWRIWETSRGNCYLHYIGKSDADKHLHDHPWDFKSIILWGGYLEHCLVPFDNSMSWELPEGPAKCYLPGSVVSHKAEDFHKITLLSPTWTLVFTGPRRREWGYMTEIGWMTNEEYREWKNGRPAGNVKYETVVKVRQ